MLWLSRMEALLYSALPDYVCSNMPLYLLLLECSCPHVSTQLTLSLSYLCSNITASVGAPKGNSILEIEYFKEGLGTKRLFSKLGCKETTEDNAVT